MFFNKQETKNKLHIIIVGCGKIGSTLVEMLSKEGHDISIIDQDSTMIQSISNTYDVLGIIGNGASFKTQTEAGILNADLMIAVTDSDELNLLCCTVAKRVSKCSTIARVRTPDYGKEVSFLTEQLGLAMIINPEYEVAREITRILTLPSALEVNSFANARAELVKYKITTESELDGILISELAKKIDGKILICAIERDDDVFIPTGNSRIIAGDVISFVTSKKDVNNFFRKIGEKNDRIKDTMIIGGGTSSYYLAKSLLAMGFTVKIIESDKAICERLSLSLPQAIIINGDASDEELLKEEGIETVKSFIPLTGIDEENIVLTLYAKQVSKAKVITKINKINFKGVISKLDLGSIVYPRYITSEAIVAYVRAKSESGSSNIETLYHMFDHRVEAIEFHIDKDSAVTNVSLAELSLKDNLLIAFINRENRIIFPSGSDCIKPGDNVMIVTTHSGFKDVTDILAKNSKPTKETPRNE